MSLLDKASLVITPNATKANKLYSVIPSDGSGDMTVVRATTATRVNSNGLIESVASNVPRIDYTDSTCPSVLIEPQRTNFALRSDEFDNAYWIKTNTIITSNSISSPDGSFTSDKLIETVVNSTHSVYNTSVSVLIDNDYTFNCFVKKGERDSISVQLFFFGSNTGYNIIVNLNDGSFTTLDTGVLTSLNKRAEVISFPNGWYKIIVGLKTSSTSTSARITSSIRNGGATSYLGDGTSGLYLWGAQLEQGSYATSYIPTVASAVTRNADVISKTGISDLIGQTEGTIFLDIKLDLPTATKSTFFSLVGGGSWSTNSFYFDELTNNKISFSSVKTSTSNGAISSASTFSNQRLKIALKYSGLSLKMYINGNSEASGSLNNQLSVIDSVYVNQLGTLTQASNFQKNYINSTAIFKTALTDQECINLTTL